MNTFARLALFTLLALTASACTRSPAATATVPATPLPAAPAEITATRPPQVAAATVTAAAPSPQPTEPLLCQNAGPEVYLVFQGVRHHIVDWETFLSLGFKSEQIRPCGDSAAAPEGVALTHLLKGSGDPVYWMEAGQRRHIPDMDTFRALGYLESNIAVVPDALLNTWPLGEPIPAVQPISARPTEAADLRADLQKIQDQFKIDTTKGCFGLLTPYTEYYQGLEQMTVVLLTDPRAQTLSLADREALFNGVVGFDGVRFYTGNGTATLVSLSTNRGYPLGCGSHAAAPDALHVLDRSQTRYGVTSEIIGPAGLVKQVWWVGDRWMVLFKLKLDSTSGPTPWAIWEIGPEGNTWQPMVKLEFTPVPYNFDPPPLRFENGYQTMIADLDYWWADDPCEFNADFKANYKHDTWQMRRTYQLTGDTYTLTASAVLTFTVQRQDTGEAVTLDWQANCTGPVR